MPAIEIDNVSKMFRLGARTTDLRERFGRLAGRGAPEKPRQFWALRDVSFSVGTGESFGIIGHNGSGKSTLLKLITGIYRPTAGHVRTQGRVAALIEVGAGFHPDLTGRENVYLNGSVLGMKRREIDRRFDEIVSFAEMEEFIDTPVKRYSSGMYMRLGFSVAAHGDPEIVLVDEVLAVGDAAFQAKCIRKLQQLRSEGRTIVFISHSMDAVAAMSRRVLLLSNGVVQALGEPRDVISHYRTRLALKDDPLERDPPGSSRPDADRELEILEVRLLDAQDRPAQTLALGEPLRLECVFRARQRIEDPAFGVTITRADGLCISGLNTKSDGAPLGPVEGDGRFGITYHGLNLMQGVYHFSVAAYRHNDTHHPIDECSRAASVTITSETLSRGVVELAHTWDVSARPAACGLRS